MSGQNISHREFTTTDLSSMVDDDSGDVHEEEESGVPKTVAL